MLENLSAGLDLILNLDTFVALSLGVLIGVVFGALPGLTTTMAMAIFVPITFFMSPFVGIPFLLGIYKGGIFGGSVSAILIRTPGTGAAAATVFDGYPLAEQGKAGKALKMALYSSCIGEVWGELVLLFIVGLLASFALLFGPPEYFAVLLFSFTIIATLSGNSLIKGIIAASFGLLIAMVGLDPISGTRRFGFGITDFDSGFSFVPLLIGLFAFSEILLQVEKRFISGGTAAQVTNLKGEGNRLSWREFKPCLPAITIGSLVGTWIGLLPGIGQPVAAFLSYGLAKQRSKNPELFGKGSLEGVAAPEAANNAVNGSAMVPLLALGIPGDTISAILLGAFIAHGLSPGPLLFENHGPVIYGILLTMILGNIIFFGISYFMIPILARIACVSKVYLLPIIMALALVGTYAVNNSIFDIYTMIVFGLIGFFMRKGRFPIAPMVITFLLGRLTESSLGQSMLLSKGNPIIFFTRPISLTFFIITAIVVIRIIVKAVKKKGVKEDMVF